EMCMRQRVSPRAMRDHPQPVPTAGRRCASSDVQRVGPELRGTTRLAGRIPDQQRDALARHGVREFDLSEAGVSRWLLSVRDPDDAEDGNEPGPARETKDLFEARVFSSQSERPRAAISHTASTLSPRIA